MKTADVSMPVNYAVKFSWSRLCFIWYEPCVRHEYLSLIFWLESRKSRRCSGAQGLNRQPAVAHICLCYPGHGGLKSLKKKAAGLWRVQVLNPSCRFSSSEMLIMCVIAWAEVWKRSRVNTITGVKAWLRFLQESLVLSRPITSFVGSVNPKYGYVSHIRLCGSFQLSHSNTIQAYGRNHCDISPRPVMWPIEVAWGTVWVCSVCKGILRLHHPVDVAHLYLCYICAFMDWLLGFSCVVSPCLRWPQKVTWCGGARSWPLTPSKDNDPGLFSQLGSCDDQY